MALVEEYIVKIIHRVSIDRPGNPGFVSNYKGVGSLQDESSRIITDFADEKERFGERIVVIQRTGKMVRSIFFTIFIIVNIFIGMNYYDVLSWMMEESKCV